MSSDKKADFSGVTASVTSTAEITSTQVYTVQKGDSLWKIAKHFYDNGNEWQKILDANSDTLKDPDKIQPGQELKIPPKNAEVKESLVKKD